MSDLRALIAGWEQGWAASRDLPAAEHAGGGLRVDSRQLGRDTEYFALDDDPAVLSGLASRVLAEPGATWLTVPTTDPDRAAAALTSAGLVLLRTSEQMMTIDLRTHPRPAVPPTYRLVLESADARVSVAVFGSGDAWAARGHAGLAGRIAVADRILTGPDHRRRGLAAAVMGELAAAAVERGADQGILVASEEGQRVYGMLGWTPAAQVLIAARPGTQYPD
ncbi:GNAT family N-acetyltransferase [Dactylosporangium sp. CS-047395]|uniref:GNAT family N-acetyltransferase n=1 Tax=Dactylosporangium sp. CS-047395 TaxID=3239936 RepID=UPI003D8E7430